MHYKYMDVLCVRHVTLVSLPPIDAAQAPGVPVPAPPRPLPLSPSHPPTILQHTAHASPGVCGGGGGPIQVVKDVHVYMYVYMYRYMYNVCMYVHSTLLCYCYIMVML